jgi:TRAP transporter 4TM/12TM fusion protein
VLEQAIQRTVKVLSVFLCLFTLFEVNYNQLQPQSALALFVMCGLVLCFLVYPAHRRFGKLPGARWLDIVLALAAVACCGYVVVQTEPITEHFWAGGISLGNRAGIETTADFIVALVGLLLVLEATRRSIGWIVPALCLLFVAHSYYCYASFRYGWPVLPDWMLPHSGQSLKDISSTTFLQSLGVFGPAAGVMFTYVFLFVVFGSFLEMSGATQFIIDFATKMFGGVRGGPAMVSVVASGLMGSLSGSAVANAVTTGAFTIPMMRGAGFPNHIAGGITAAAASGGALMPPVMGAGAYMMLELVQPAGGFLTVMKAAVIPAILYYLSILSIVYLYSRKLGTGAVDREERSIRPLPWFEGVVFLGALGILIGLLVLGFSPFKSVTGALALILVLATQREELGISRHARLLASTSFFVILVLHQLTGYVAGTLPAAAAPFVASSWVHPTTGSANFFLIVESLLGSAIMAMFALLVFGIVHPAWRPRMIQAFQQSSSSGISLIAASACVGIIIGIVQQTGIATDFSAAIKDVVETNLFLALCGIMVCSLILGMGVPSVVCYLLMATLMGSLLDELGVIPLAAHLFIFYFGMMSMVTPPVALAGYASASIAGAPIMQTSFAAFRFSLVGFTLPFMFVYRPALCLLADQGQGLKFAAVVHAVTAAVVGILALAGGLAGYWRRPLSLAGRGMMFLAAALLLAPITRIGPYKVGLAVDVVGGAVFLLTVLGNSARLPVKENPAPTRG